MNASLRKLFLLFMLMLLPALGRAEGRIITYLSYGIYIDAATGPYLELYLKIPASTLHYYDSKNGSFTGGVAIEYALIKGDSVKAHESYKLSGPAAKDTDNLTFNLLDLRRMDAPKGDYSLKMVIRDLNDEHNYSTIVQRLRVSASSAETRFGSVLLLDTFYASTQQRMFTRDGVDYMPLVSTLLTQERKSLSFYTELYNIQKQVNDKSRIRINYYLKDISGHKLPAFSGSLQHSVASFIPLVQRLDISRLATGEYTLNVEACNDKNEVLTNVQSVFVRINEPLTRGFDLGERMFANVVSFADIKNFSPYMDAAADKDEMEVYNSIIAAKDTVRAKQWFYRFWRARDSYSSGRAYAAFLNRVDTADKYYSTPDKKGSLSDRGRILLRYGKPDNVADYPETASTYPYTVWLYYHLGMQNNAKFIFYRHTQKENDYELLSADVRGFAYKPDWMDVINNRAKNGWTESKAQPAKGKPKKGKE